MPQTREIAIDRATQAIGQLETRYQSHLIAQLEELHTAASESDWAQVVLLAHNISGEAGSLGWPHASTAAALLRHTIEEETVKQRKHAVALCLDSLNLVVKEHFKGHCKEGKQLIDQLTHMVNVLSDQDGQ